MPEQNVLNVTFEDLQSFINFYRYWNKTNPTQPEGFSTNVLSKMVFSGTDTSSWSVAFNLPSTFNTSVTFNSSARFNSGMPAMQQLELNHVSNPYIQFSKSSAENYYIQRYDWDNQDLLIIGGSATGNKNPMSIDLNGNVKIRNSLTVNDNEVATRTWCNTNFGDATKQKVNGMFSFSNGVLTITPIP